MNLKSTSDLVRNVISRNKALWRTPLPALFAPSIPSFLGVFVVAFAVCLVVPTDVSAQDAVDVQTYAGLDASSDTVYFNFRTEEIVPVSEAWDLAFKGTTILVNGEGKIVEVAFKKLAEAPLEGYKRDMPGEPSIPTSNGSGWFDYDSSSHMVSPVPFRTLAFKLASGGFAKMEIVDYYAADGTPRSYTFRYALSEDGKF